MITQREFHMKQREEEEAAATTGEVTVERVDVLIALIARGWVTPKRIVTRCMGFPTRSHRSLDQRRKSLDFLMRSIRSIWSLNPRNPATKLNPHLYHVFQQPVSLNPLKVLVLGYSTQVPLIIFLVISPPSHPFLFLFSDDSASRFCIIIHFTLTMVSFLLSLTRIDYIGIGRTWRRGRWWGWSWWWGNFFLRKSPGN